MKIKCSLLNRNDCLMCVYSYVWPYWTITCKICYFNLSCSRPKLLYDYLLLYKVMCYLSIYVSTDPTGIERKVEMKNQMKTIHSLFECPWTRALILPITKSSASKNILSSVLLVVHWIEIFENENLAWR